MGKLNKEKQIHRKDEKGEYLVVTGEVADVASARRKRDSIECGPSPRGYHYWMGKAQRSSRGRRGIYSVWYRKTERGKGR